MYTLTYCGMHKHISKRSTTAREIPYILYSAQLPSCISCYDIIRSLSQPKYIYSEYGTSTMQRPRSTPTHLAGKHQKAWKLLPVQGQDQPYRPSLIPSVCLLRFTFMHMHMHMHEILLFLYTDKNYLTSLPGKELARDSEAIRSMAIGAHGHRVIEISLKFWWITNFRGNAMHTFWYEILTKGTKCMLLYAWGPVFLTFIGKFLLRDSTQLATIR